MNSTRKFTKRVKIKNVRKQTNSIPSVVTVLTWTAVERGLFYTPTCNYKNPENFGVLDYMGRIHMLKILSFSDCQLLIT